MAQRSEAQQGKDMDNLYSEEVTRFLEDLQDGSESPISESTLQQLKFTILTLLCSKRDLKNGSSSHRFQEGQE